MIKAVLFVFSLYIAYLGIMCYNSSKKIEKIQKNNDEIQQILENE